MRKTMALDEYRKKALEFAGYKPINGHSVLYPIAGLIGELGEVSDIVKRLWRDNEGRLDYSSIYEMVMEIGDACWFVVAIENELGIEINPLDEVSFRADGPIMAVLLLNEASGSISGSIVDFCVAQKNGRSPMLDIDRCRIGKYLHQRD